MWYFYLAVALGVTLVACFGVVSRRKNVDIILRAGFAKHKVGYGGTRHIMFCLADHFEPFWRNEDRKIAVERVRQWLLLYPKVVDTCRDNGGRPPQHSFFYPQEEYIPETLDMLAELTRRGYGDVEIHLHHDRDTSSGLLEKLLSFKQLLHDRHGLLHRNASNGVVEYGFIHGMWALDDSWGDGKWCGVKNEISILKETGCYADFTFPSAPHRTQPPIVNRIYYATDDPHRARSHHRGINAEFNSDPKGDLLLINGPLAINWRNRKRHILPSIENGAVTGINPPTPGRVRLWIQSNVCVDGWPSWVFVKVYTHGTQERNSAFLLGEGFRRFYEHLLTNYNDGTHYILHFLTAREMYQCVKALESGDRDSISRIESFDYTPR